MSQGLRTKREVNRFLARWLDKIEEFRFDVEHVPGRLTPVLVTASPPPLGTAQQPRRTLPTQTLW